MISDFYETNFQSYQNLTVNIDPVSFLAPLTHHLKKGSKILDVGCGSGRDLLWLKERGYLPTGFERSSGLVEFARKHSGCPVVEGDFFTFDFSVFRFDVVISIGGFVHLQHHELTPILSRVVRAIGRDGLIFLTLKEGVGCFKNEDGRVFSLWQHEDLKRIFDALRFRILDFSRNESSLNQKELWLGYLLEKKIGKA